MDFQYEPGQVHLFYREDVHFHSFFFLIHGIKRKYGVLLIAEKVETLINLDSGVSVRTINETCDISEIYDMFFI